MISHIENAVGHLKAEAIRRAEKYALEVAAKVRAAIAEKGSVAAAAPYPKTWTVSSNEYRAMVAKYKLYCFVQSEKGAAQFVQAARENAAAQYDAFVAKLNAKIGPVTSAKLEGNHVWGFSFLHVETPAGPQIWKTQTIINVSKLGKVFNQYPTRQVKAAK